MVLNSLWQEFTIGHRELDRFEPAFALDYFDCSAGSYSGQDLDLHPDEVSGQVLNV